VVRGEDQGRAAGAAASPDITWHHKKPSLFFAVCVPDTTRGSGAYERGASQNSSSAHSAICQQTFQPGPLRPRGQQQAIDGERGPVSQRLARYVTWQVVFLAQFMSGFCDGQLPPIPVAPAKACFGVYTPGRPRKKIRPRSKKSPNLFRFQLSSSPQPYSRPTRVPTQKLTGPLPHPEPSTYVRLCRNPDRTHPPINRQMKGEFLMTPLLLHKKTTTRRFQSKQKKVRISLFNSSSFIWRLQFLWHQAVSESRLATK
jgi:hypothetical protein